MKSIPKLEKTLKNSIYALPFIIASALPGKAEGQIYDNWRNPNPPFTKIDLFVSPDNSDRTKEYNSLKTRAQKDSIIQERLTEDWVNTIPYSISQWNCNHYAIQLTINSINFGGSQDSLYYADLPMFKWYNGLDKDSIYKFAGTCATSGKNGIPSMFVSLYDKTTLAAGHSMNGILTGNDLTKWEDWNFIEPQRDQMNVQPGQAIMPTDVKEVMISYTYFRKEKGDVHEKNYHMIPVVLFKIENGVGKFVELNPYLKDVLITKREGSNGIENKINDTYKLSMYPNPFDNQFTIIDNIQRPQEVIITTITGQVIYQTTKTEGTMTITDPKVTTQPAGMYIIKVGDRARKIFKEKCPNN